MILRLLPLFWLVGCVGTGGDSPPESGPFIETGDAGIAVAGSWVDDFGASHVITDTTWTIDYGFGGNPSVFALTQFDNTALFAVGQNDSANPYNAGMWSRFDWVTDETDQLWMCQTAYAAPSETDAASTPRADTADLATGCGGFPWSTLDPA